MPLLLAAIQGLWSVLRKVPPLYLAVALLAGALWLEHARLQRCLSEKQTISNALRTAVDANRGDAATIAAQRSALAALTTQLDQERAAAVAAADAAVRRNQVLQTQLAADQKLLASLQSDPHYAPFLNIDLDAQYPDLAKWLRDADRGQD